MVQKIKDHILYFSVYSIITLILLILLFNINKGDDIIFLSRFRNPVLDQFCRFFTHIGGALFFALFYLSLAFRKMKYLLIGLMTGAVVIILIVGLKNFFGTPRPILFFTDAGRIHELNLINGVKLLTGSNSFPSGHTVSAFTIFTFSALQIRKNLFDLFFLFMAILVGFSRIYLSHHFLVDVLFGSIIGVLVALAIASLSENMDWPKWTEYSFIEWRKKRKTLAIS